MRRAIRITCAALVGAAALSAFIIAGCSKENHTEPIPRNQPPVVEITNGAADSTSTSYITTFGWHGEDGDGAIDHYLYAVDDSSTGWVETTDTSVELHLTASNPDPDDPAGALGWHSFWVRAVDDDGARSAPDGRSFNARTIAPTSRIVSPRFDEATMHQVFQGTSIEWDGEDLDGSQANGRPIGWEIKLVRISDYFESNGAMEDSLRRGPNLLATTEAEDPTAWLPLPGATRSLTLDPRLAAATLVFGVRAIDEAGAREPVLVPDRNFLAFIVNPNYCQPFVTVREPAGTSHVFPISPPDGDRWDVTVSCGSPIQFRWSIDASHCGLDPGESAFRWDDGPWSDWATRSDSGEPVAFPCEDGPMTHTFWLKARPIGGGPEWERLCEITVSVTEFPRDRFALWVDDARLGRSPTDQAHDQFLKETVLAEFHARGEVDQFTLFGSASNENSAPTPNQLTFEQLAHYQNVIWSTHPYPIVSQMTGLYGTERSSHSLSRYISAGGRVLFIGNQIAGQLLGGRMGSARYPQPFNPTDPTDGAYNLDSFVWRFLHFRGPIVSLPSLGSAPPEQRAASGLIAARSLDPAYPDLVLDSQKWTTDELVNCDEDPALCEYRGGIRDWEGFQRLEGQETGAGFDSIYAATTFDRYWDASNHEGVDLRSGVRNAIVAHRFESTVADTTLGLAQGRVMVFGFEPWYFQRDGLVEAGRAAATWLITGEE